MARNNYSIGLVLIVVAVVLLLGKVGIFGFLGHLFWPMFILIPGLLFHFLYFNRTFPAGVLVPGGILVTYSLMFFFCNFFGWGLIAYIWPGFIFGVAVGLYELFLFQRNSPRGILLAAIIVAVISLALFGMVFLVTLGIYFIALVLIVVGAGLILGRRRSF